MMSSTKSYSFSYPPRKSLILKNWILSEMVVVEMSHSALALCNRPGYLPRSIFQCYWVLKNKTTEASIKVP